MIKRGSSFKYFRLKNKAGVDITISNYGARITSIFFPDKKGNLADVALGFKTAEEYVNAINEPCFGCIVGRVGNRIANGQFNLDGKVYSLAKNNGTNHLHGGVKGFDKVTWDVVGEGKNEVRFAYLSKDGEEGYPGNLNIELTYRLNEDSELFMEYEARTDKATPINVTNHTYFNLAGEGSGTVLDHEIMIDADKFIPTNKNQIPLGSILDVKNTPFDFRKAKAIGRDIEANDEQLRNGCGYDHTFVLNKRENKNSLTHAATAYHAASGRVLEVLTDQPGVQLYTGNCLNGKSIGKSGRPYIRRSGFCLETQHYPDSPNQPQFPSIILRPGELYKTATVYRFSIKRS
jgi:aldose 1-epimerase